MSDLEQEIADAMGEDIELPPDGGGDIPPEAEYAPGEGDSDVPAAGPVPAASPPAVDDQVMEKRYKAADRATQTYVKRISEIFEEQALDLIECPLCPPIHKGFLNKYDAGRVPDEVKDAAMVFLGFAREKEYNPDGDVNECRRCGGLGKTRTGSRVPGNETRKCPSCRGYGFVPPPGATDNGAGSLDTHLAPIADELSPFPTAEVDAWNEPRILPDGRENPNYGKMPQFKIRVEPWGATAGLTAQDAVAAT